MSREKLLINNPKSNNSEVMRNKQIEEMWNIITTDCDRECVGCEFENDEWCFTRFVINKLYNAGYRKQSEGEWKYPPYAPFGGSYEMKRCSVCGYKPDFDSDNPYTKFCPNCGAKMGGGKE